MPDVEAGEQRAGGAALAIFTNPVHAPVLRAHADGPRRLVELHAAVNSLPESTLRAAIATLCEVGALERRPLGESSRAVLTALSPAGRELLCLADTLETWLARSPGGPIDLGGEEAKGAVKALAGGWSSTLIREMAGRPVTLAELDQAIPELSYPMLERRVNWMRKTGQIEPVQREGRGTPYVVTEWLRHAIAPLAVSGRCERRHMSEGTAPITEVEIEAAFLMSLPLAPMPGHATGRCLLAAHTDPDQTEPPTAPLAGVTVEVSGGEIRSCGPNLATDPPTWAMGSPDAWLDAVIDGDIADLRIAGAKPQLALDLVAGIHTALFCDR